MLLQFGAGGTTCCCNTFEFTYRLVICVKRGVGREQELAMVEEKGDVGIS